METEAMKYLSAAIVMGMGAIGSALGEAHIGGKAMDAMGRNPKMIDKLFTNMIVAIALDESTAIYALVVALIILFV